MNTRSPEILPTESAPSAPKAREPESPSPARIYSTTRALCDTCAKPVQARIEEAEGAVWLTKHCPEHGPGRARLSSSIDWYRGSRAFVKPGQPQNPTGVAPFAGCPNSCGFCAEHRQHACLPVVEITSRCDLRCPVCLKGSPTPFELCEADFDRILTSLFAAEGTVPVLNLSGGEPTLHPKLPAFLEMARDRGVLQTSLSTHGLTLLGNPALLATLQRTQTLVALQFDGFSARTSVALRGRDYTEQKRAVIRTLEDANIPYSLVATVARGINDHEIAEIVDFFFASKAITLMLQPLCLAGRARDWAAHHRLTVFDVVEAIGKSRQARSADFTPLPCSHYTCFALAYYLHADGEGMVPLRDFLGQEAYLDVIANRTLPGLDASGQRILRDRLYEVWSLADSAATQEQVLRRLREALRLMSQGGYGARDALALGKRSLKAIFIHDFMDVHTFDFGRLVKCCNPYPQADGRLVPMCGYNVLQGGAS